MTHTDIAVIGAGIGGLALGLALRRHGIDVQIYEQAPELAEVGAAVALAANGTRILQELGLGSALENVSSVPTELVYRHWADASRLAAHPVGAWYEQRFGAPFWGIHRAHLQRSLAEGWGTEGLHLGKALVDVRVEGDVNTLRFVDGSVVTAQLVVGADGIRSRVRKWITDTELVYSGTSGFRGLVPRSAIPGFPDPDAVQFWMGPEAHLLHYAVGDAINFLAVVRGPDMWESDGSVAPAAKGELPAAFRDWHPVVRQLIEAVPQSPRWGLFALPPLTHWSKDRVVLLGDAAHAMLPHHGQGANQTLEDAAVLADCLRNNDNLTAALVTYERLRRCRTRQVQRSSWDTSAVLHLPDGPVADDRNARLVTLDDRLAWIHGYTHHREPVLRA